MAQLAAGQTLDSSRLDSLPGKSNFRFGIVYEFGLNTALTPLPGLRSFLRANQIKQYGHLSSAINMNLGLRVNRVKIMALGQSTFYKTPKASNNWIQQNWITSGGVLVGYDVLNSFNRRVFLFLGFGGADYQVSLYQQSSQTIPFQSVLTATPQASVPSLVLRNAGYFDVAIEICQREKRKVSPYTTTRIGYRTGTFKKAWESDTYTFTDPIKDRFSQFYFQFIIAYSINANGFTPFSRKPFRR